MVINSFILWSLSNCKNWFLTTSIFFFKDDHWNSRCSGKVICLFQSLSFIKVFLFENSRYRWHTSLQVCTLETICRTWSAVMFARLQQHRQVVPIFKLVYIFILLLATALKAFACLASLGCTYRDIIINTKNCADFLTFWKLDDEVTSGLLVLKITIPI